VKRSRQQPSSQVLIASSPDIRPGRRRGSAAPESQRDLGCWVWIRADGAALGLHPIAGLRARRECPARPSSLNRSWLTRLVLRPNLGLSGRVLLPPRPAGLAERAAGGRAHLRPQRASIPAPSGFWLNHAVRGDQKGAEGTIIVPHPNLSAKAVPPLGQYFLAAAKADEPISAPKGRGPRTPSALSLQTSRFQGAARRGQDRHRGPWQADAVVVGEGHAPLWRYFTRLLEGTSRVCKKTQTAC
jgi:hypothetical protein